MPVIATFDFERPSPAELNRLRGAFERLGWQHLGNTAYRYPALDDSRPTEDWFNHVVPALMLLRAFARHAARTGRAISRFSLDVQSSTGFDPIAGVGTPPLAGEAVPLRRGGRMPSAPRLVRRRDVALRGRRRRPALTGRLSVS